MSSTWIAVIGDRVEGFEPHDTITDAIEHSTKSLGLHAPRVQWIATDQLANDGAALVDGASGVWCAPGGPFRSLDGAIDGIRWARESNVPFIGTCAGFQHGVIEFARNVLGYREAAHAEYGEAEGDVLFIDELLCSLVGQTMQVEIVDDELVEIYGTRSPTERYYCRFGLEPRWRQPLHDAGLRVAGVDAQDGDVRIMRVPDHPFYVLTLFVPQTSSTPLAPHPLVTAFVRAVAAG
jgi:CTP synthase (UTP-ammonia lyase)